MSGVEKEWSADELEQATDTLVGKPVLDQTSMMGDHREVIGEVEDSWYDEDRGVVYEASIQESEIEPVLDGEADIAPEMVHARKNDSSSSDPVVVTDIEFRALFRCPAASDGVPHDEEEINELVVKRIK